MSDFLDDEQRKRLAYADRAETLEERRRCADGHLIDCVLPIDGNWRCTVGCAYTAAGTAAIVTLADGTGRHSCKEMAQDATIAAWDYALGAGPFSPSEGKPDAMAATQTIAGVQFSSVPALCAAFEQLLSASAAYLWTWRPDREHCSGPQMEAYRELRRLVAGAGKDVP